MKKVKFLFKCKAKNLTQILAECENFINYILERSD